MTSVRAAKSKGSAMEYDTQYSLEQKGWEVTRTSERGYQRQFDLEAIETISQAKHYYAIECKRLKGISWNQCVKFLEKLKTVAPKNYKCLLIFKSNNQPALVMYSTESEILGKYYKIQEFESFFNCKFLKHPSTRVKNDKDISSE